MRKRCVTVNSISRTYDGNSNARPDVFAAISNLLIRRKHDMPNQLIELEDGLLVEVDVLGDQVNQIAGGVPEQVDKAIDTVLRPVLLKACRPVVSVWQELNKEMCIDKAQTLR
ncbi:MAG: hypothetical protein D3910_25025 [Candidatus Electrothrix sp. ATG2]|nr:hypothetical protein [Candidatus Electrothrix sp. ATG2]